MIGTDAAAVALVTAAIQRKPQILLLGLAIGYAFAWVGHFFVEHNRPAAFQYPVWSLIADWKMWAFRLSGRLPTELRRHGIEP